MEDQYAAQLNEARNQEYVRRAQHAEKAAGLARKIAGKGKKGKMDIAMSILGITGGATFIELIPGGDILPTYIFAVWAMHSRLKAGGHNPNSVEVMFLYMIAFFADALDWLVIGSIPIVGDIFDIIMSMIIGFWGWLKSHSS